MSRRRKRQPDTTLSEGFRDLKNDFEIGQTSRYLPPLTGTAAMGSGADFHFRNESQFIRGIERARAFDRNNMVVGQGVTRLVDNVMRDGLRVNPQTGDPKLDVELRQDWNEWGADKDACDRAGEKTFDQMAHLTLRTVVVDGDIVHLPDRSTGSLQAVEAHRLRTPRTKRNVVLGVLLDEFRKRIEYWFAPDDVDPFRPLKVGDMTRIPVRDRFGRRQLFHVYNPDRFTQTRGITTFARIVYPAGIHDDLQFANLVKAQVASCYTILRERNEQFQSGSDSQRGERTVDTYGDGVTRVVEGISPGMEIIGEVGETISGFSPNIPNPEFFDHAMMTLSIVAVNLGLPLMVLMLDPKQTNFSGWRGAMQQAETGFRRMQRFMRDGFYRPVYLWRLQRRLHDDAALRKRAGLDIGPDGNLIQAGTGEVNVFAHDWRLPRFPYIEPNKDIKADVLRVDEHQTSPRRVVAERLGEEFKTIAAESVEDTGLLIELAITEAERLNKAHAEANVDWREVARFQAKSPAAETSDDSPQRTNAMMEAEGNG